MKKKYNPFKMTGTWIVAGIGLFPGINTIYNNYQRNKACIIMSQYGGSCSQSSQILVIPSLIVFPIIGFLISWGIISLVRKIR